MHLFERACNLVNEQGEVLSLVAPEIGAGPFHVVVRAFWAKSSTLTSDSPVFIEPNVLQIGPLRVGLSQAVLWESQVNWVQWRATTAVWQPQIPLMRTMVERYRQEKGLDTAVTPQLEAGLNRLLAGIAAQELSLVQAGAQQLAGLGTGLTPAGDDILLGAIYSLWATYPSEVAHRLAAVMVDVAAPQTTTLSAAWLRAAARGEAGVMWHELGDRLSVNGNRWEEAVVRILAVGHSSGADALWGFTAVMMLS